MCHFIQQTSGKELTRHDLFLIVFTWFPVTAIMLCITLRYKRTLVLLTTYGNVLKHLCQCLDHREGINQCTLQVHPTSYRGHALIKVLQTFNLLSIQTEAYPTRYRGHILIKALQTFNLFSIQPELQPASSRDHVLIKVLQTFNRLFSQHKVHPIKYWGHI